MWIRSARPTHVANTSRRGGAAIRANSVECSQTVVFRTCAGIQPIRKFLPSAPGQDQEPDAAAVIGLGARLPDAGKLGIGPGASVAAPPVSSGLNVNGPGGEASA